MGECGSFGNGWAEWTVLHWCLDVGCLESRCIKIVQYAAHSALDGRCRSASSVCLAASVCLLYGHERYWLLRPQLADACTVGAARSMRYGSDDAWSKANVDVSHRPFDCGFRVVFKPSSRCCQPSAAPVPAKQWQMHRGEDRLTSPTLLRWANHS